MMNELILNIYKEEIFNNIYDKNKYLSIDPSNMGCI